MIGEFSLGDVFISYKQDERELMRPIADALRALDVDVWFDERLQPDRSFTEEIQSLIQTCKAQLVCWSPAAVASEWVRGEAEKGRTRGVLVAVLIEPCDLPPPFNMHHAENLSGWTGDPRHTGWRKVADAIGRKLDRPGLGDLAALQGSEDADAWKRWAQKNPHDPFVDAAWAKAEEIEIGAARARMARDRAAAAERAAQAPGAPIAAAPSTPARVRQRKRGCSPVALGVMIGVGGLAAASAVMLAPRFGLFAEEQAAAIGPKAEALAVAPATSVAAPTPPSTAAPSGVAAPSAEALAAPALRALAAISAHDWSITDGPMIVRRVISGSSVAALRSAAASDARAQTVLGMAHADGASGVERDYGESARLYRRAAAQGFARAQANLGRMFDLGEGVSEDDAEAARWYRLAADQGNARAQHNLGILYDRGQGVSENDAESLRLFRLAADQGNARSYTSLGIMYYNGHGVAQDYGEAARHYRRAVEMGEPQAMSALGDLYLRGLGVTQDEVEAVRLFRLSSDQNNQWGQANLAVMHENGRGGLSPDRAEAVRLYRLAARQGNQFSRDALTRLGEAW